MTGHVMAGGAITLTAGEAETVLAALDDATGARRERAAASCCDCVRHVSGLCDDHAADLDRAREYEALAGRLAALDHREAT